MANSDNDGGDRTEHPTPHRLRDARKKGEVAKSRELTGAATLGMWLVLWALAAPWVAHRVESLVLGMFDSLRLPFPAAVAALGAQAIGVLAEVTGLVLAPVAAVGLAMEFWQAGPVFTMEKARPRLKHLDPLSGLKRICGLDNLFEFLKVAFKAALLCGAGWAALAPMLPSLAALPTLQPAQAGLVLRHVACRLLAGALAASALVGMLDWAWQRRRHFGRMRMSPRDIRQEVKDHEGDPHAKAQRQQTRREWAERNAASAAAQAHVLVVNPTHVAIAIDYDRDTCPVPVLSCKGEGAAASAMRAAARSAGVPVVRNIALACDMLVRAEVGEAVPQDLFEVMAEIILWAHEVRAELQAQGGPPPPGGHNIRRRAAPGEDLTAYPGGR